MSKSNRHNSKQYPSFMATYGRKPKPEIDFDPDDLCQDDYEYFTGTGRYTDHPIEMKCTTQKLCPVHNIWHAPQPQKSGGVTGF